MIATDPIVYIVDDDASIRASLSLLLQSAGYEVQVFPSAEAFLESAHDLRRQACLISDVKMPGISGLDLQDELVTTDSPIPMIFITGHGDIPMSVRTIKKRGGRIPSQTIRGRNIVSGGGGSPGQRRTGPGLARRAKPNTLTVGGPHPKRARNPDLPHLRSVEQTDRL